MLEGRDSADALRRLDEAMISAQLRRIEELRVEKEHYTQKYLEEKRKYDELLEKINSTSTLGSYIQSTVGPSRVIPEQEPRAASGTHEPVITEGEGQADDFEELAMLEAPIQPSTSGPSGSTLQDDPLFFSLPVLRDKPSEDAESTTRDAKHAVLDFEPATYHDAPPALCSPSRPASSLSRQLQPGAAPTPSLLNPLSAMADGSSLSDPKSPKRDKARKVAKRGARGAGIALSVAVGAVLFPISIPLYIVFRNRRRSHIFPPDHPWSRPPRPSPSRPVTPPVPGWKADRLWPEVNSEAGPSDYVTPIPYHSSMLHAELPNTPELMPHEAGVRPEMALVGRLIAIEKVRQAKDYGKPMFELNDRAHLQWSGERSSKGKEPEVME
jgi:hypothetical protein